MHRRDASGVAGGPGVQEIEGLATADLTDEDWCAGDAQRSSTRCPIVAGHRARKVPYRSRSIVQVRRFLEEPQGQTSGPRARRLGLS